MTRLAKNLCDGTVDRIVERFDLDEVTADDGGPWRTLTSPMAGGAAVGHVRVLHGGPVHKLVKIGLEVEMIGLDSHMVFAFAAPDSAVPHFTLDSVQAPQGPPGARADGEAATADLPSTYAFHLDLIPRVDLGANLAYLDTVYGPLEKHVAASKDADGLTPAHLSTRQLAIMSPWMLAYRADADAFAGIDTWVNAYLDHWFDLCRDGGLDALDLASIDLAERDRRNRGAIFNPDVDPVWAQVAQLVGDDQAEEARHVLLDQNLPD